MLQFVNLIAIGRARLYGITSRIAARCFLSGRVVDVVRLPFLLRVLRRVPMTDGATRPDSRRLSSLNKGSATGHTILTSVLT